MTDAAGVEIDDADVRRMLLRAHDLLPLLIDDAAEELRDKLATESAGASSRVSESWDVDQQGRDTSKVSSDVFFAGWLARGTSPHGPRKAPRMVFAIDGHGVSTTFVQGVADDPFDERAIDKTQDRVPTLLEYLVAEAGG
jgi:hypothetical protein